MITIAYAVWLEPASVCELLPVHALSLHGTPEENVSDGHDDVVDDATTSDQATQRLVLVKLTGSQRTYLISQPRTLLEPLLSCMNDRQGKHMTTKKQ